MTSSKRNISALLVFCVGNSPVTGEFPAQRPVTRNFGVFFDLHLNKRLSKQSSRRWFETPSRPLRRQCKATFSSIPQQVMIQDNAIVKMICSYRMIFIAEYLNIFPSENDHDFIVRFVIVILVFGDRKKAPLVHKNNTEFSYIYLATFL